MEMAKNMIYAQCLKFEFLVDAVVDAMYTRNRCLTKALESTTPEEAWNGRWLHIEPMRVFKCIRYAMMSDEKMIKLDAKG